MDMSMGMGHRAKRRANTFVPIPATTKRPITIVT